MSLLMEALRKAEEAKSKASQAGKEKQTDAEDTAAAGKAMPENGPIVINPDPDEEEILSSHSLESTLELVEMEQEEVPEPDDELEQFEFTPIPPLDSGNDAGISGDDGEAGDESMPLLQSSYFNRMQNTGSSLLDDDDEITEDADAATLADRHEEEPSRTPAPAPVAQAAHEDSAARKDRERANRDSAGALFQAKEDSQRRRMKKLLSIAAIALVFPLAGIVFWLFTSLNSGPSVQFNVPTGGNFANRSFSDSLSQPEPEQTGLGETDLVTDTGAEANLPPEADTDSTASTLMAMADNAAAESAEQEPPASRTPPPLPVPQAAQAIPAQAAETEPAVQEPVRTVTSESTAQPAVSTPTRSTPVASGQASGPALSFARSETERVINPDLVAAYESYQQADYATADRLYQQVLATEPNNRDALLHLASVHLKQNNPALARNFYTRLLELNPRDPLARAGILETLQGDPTRQESELKSLISAFPATAQLSFALGNLYAKQNRWSEAQSAYFDALLAAKSNDTGPVSPDYAFNLAVSLERINQLRSALDYYREAETQARVTRPGFDPALLQQRLNYLEQRLR